MAYHKTRGIAFGGVHDVEESEEGIESEFFDNLYAWNIDRNRFFPLTLRKPRAQGKKQAQQQGERGGGRRGRGKADEEELLRNLAALETKGSVADSDAVQLDNPAGKDEDRTDSEKPEQPVLYTMPHPRFNAQLAVQDDVLYIYGGTFESGDKEFTFDEMYAIDLGKLDGAKQIFHREIENWAGSEDEDSEDDEDEDDEDDEDEEMAEAGSTAGETESVATSATAATGDTTTTATSVEEETEASTSRASDDPRPYPRPFESLREFYARTSETWQELLLSEMKGKDSAGASSVKELKKSAFVRAEERWWDCREEIMELEDQQEEAGIGEVVSLKDKEGAGGGVGRRR